MSRRVSALRMLGFVAAAGMAGAMSSPVAGKQGGQQPVKFSEAELFFELNDTDGDLGIHGSVDGEPWTDLEIAGPGERMLLSVFSSGRLRTQGMTQLFFESAEPSFEDLSPERFFLRFPEGRYEIEGRLQNGREIRSVALLSHVLAAPPENVTVSGVPAAEGCDAPNLPIVPAPVTIAWDPVSKSHPEVGKQGNVKIRLYQLFVEREGIKLSLDLPANVTAFEVPPGVTRMGDQFKFEIIARTVTGNNTAVESCFIMQ